MPVFSEADITSIIADTEKLVLDLAQETLRKGEGSKSDGGSAGGPPIGDAPGEGSSASADGGSSASAPDAADPSAPPAPPVASAAASPSPAAAAPAPAGDPSAAAASADPSAAAAGAPGAEGMGDHEALVAEFAKMPPEHVAMILEAAKQVLLSAQPPGGAPPAGGAPAPAAEPSAPPAGLAQSEASAHKGIGDKSDAVPAGAEHRAPGNAQASFPGTANNGQSPMHPGSESGNMHAKLASPADHIENHLGAPAAKSASDGGPMNPGAETGSTHVPDSSMLRTTSQAPEGGFHGAARKSEVDAELATLRKANEELNAKLERLIGVTTDLVERPVRKAITGMEYVSIRGTPGQDPSASAPKRLAPQEITNRLSEKVRDPRLTKADRELINDYYDHRVDVSKIEHLLK